MWLISGYLYTYLLQLNLGHGNCLSEWLWHVHINVTDHRNIHWEHKKPLPETLPKSIVFVFFHYVYHPGRETAVFIKQCFKCCLPFCIHVLERSVHVFKFPPEYPSIVAYFHPIYSLFCHCKQLIFLNKYVYLIQMPLRLLGRIQMHTWKLFYSLATS